MKTALILCLASLITTGIAPDAHAKTASEILALPSAAERGAAIARELATRNAGYGDLTGEVEMVLVDAGGSEAKRAFTLKLLEGKSPEDGDRSLIVFSSPADVKGTAVLSHSGPESDEQWVFLPSARRTRRVSTSNRSGAFVGSEFTFEDLTGNDSRKYNWNHEGTEACGDARCVVVSATPKREGSAYSKRVLRIDASTFRIQSVEFFDRSGARMKTLVYDDFRQLERGFWRAHRWTMTNHQSGRKTIVRFTSIALGRGYAAKDFAPDKLGG